ncbi:MAG: AAA family ATPase [Candidatus Chisholmbacteria bacterium]|nr:AAA family ATPase [Candidatus Chisholmbacteria bacterium]
MPANTAVAQEVAKLRSKLGAGIFPEELQQKTADMLERLERLGESGTYTTEYERTAHYIDWIVNLPWNSRSDDSLDLTKAKEVFDRHHYGLEEIKQRMLEFISVIKLTTQKNPTHSARAPIICLVGLVGTGKTTFAASLAQALGRKLARIPFGGMGSARDLRGQSRLHLEAEPGYVIKALRRVQVKNPVILLDEIDRVSDSARADIMGVLVELLDPEQNSAFVDHYIDYPFDLSEVLFLATANNTTSVATAVMDRLEVHSMPSYSDAEKIQIGQNYLLPQALEEAGLSSENLSFDESLWPKIVRPLGFDAGIRTLQRNIKSITRKLALEVVEGKTHHLTLTDSNLREYLPA